MINIFMMKSAPDVVKIVKKLYRRYIEKRIREAQMAAMLRTLVLKVEKYADREWF